MAQGFSNNINHDLWVKIMEGDKEEIEKEMEENKRKMEAEGNKEIFRETADSKEELLKKLDRKIDEAFIKSTKK